MNPLEQFPQVRQWAYRAFWVVGIILGGIQAFCAATDANAPTWVGGALAVLAYVSIATNYTADRNVSPTTTAETPLEARGFVDDGIPHRDDPFRGDASSKVRMSADHPDALAERIARGRQEQDVLRHRRREGGFVDNSAVVTIMCIVVIIAGLIFIVRAL
jgi:hypothetical protein